MARRGLLSRLDSEGSHASAEDPSESIVAHLKVLLNTRVGDAATVPEFGVVDFTDVVHQFPASVQVLQQSIRETILHFEPRLKNVSVRHVPDEDPLQLRFEITGHLSDAAVARGGGGRTRGMLRFRTQLHPGGKMDVW
jgi:type VI secretion system protein